MFAGHYTYGPTAHLAIKLLGIFLILALGLRLIELCSLKAEFQADAFAARLIGAEEVAKGIQAHARKTKAGISASARRRLAWLSAHRPQKTA